MFTEKVTPKENLNSMDSMVRGYHGTSPMVEKLVLPYHPSMLLIRSVMEKQCTVIGLKMIPTDHLARYTFATIVTLSNGVPIETVGQMLGHKNLRTTQHYTKIIDREVSEDMAPLQSRVQLFSNRPIRA